MTLEQMKSVDIRTVDPDTVIDAKDINININLPVPERMADYARQSINPYILKVGKILVKLGYSDTTDTADDCFERYLKTC
jgi:hypothetical protein